MMLMISVNVSNLVRSFHRSCEEAVKFRCPAEFVCFTCADTSGAGTLAAGLRVMN